MLFKNFWKRGQNVIILKSGYGLVTRSFSTCKTDNWSKKTFKCDV